MFDSLFHVIGTTGTFVLLLSVMLLIDLALASFVLRGLWNAYAPRVFDGWRDLRRNAADRSLCTPLLDHLTEILTRRA
jgi:hypothetical protein